MVWSGIQGNGLDPMYRAALLGAHVVYNRVDITDYLGNVIVSNLPITSGSVQATLANRVARRLSFTTTRDFAPMTAAGALDPTAALAPFGNRVLAYRGIQYGDGSTAYFPAFAGRLDSVAITQDGQVTVNASDLAAEVVDTDFETPTSSNPSLAVSDQFQNLIKAAVAGAVFGTSDTFAAAIPFLNWQNDRAKACDDLAAAVGGMWYPLADGSFVIRRIPWTVSGKTPVVTFADQGGGLISFRVSVTRSGIKNSVVYTSERLDGGAPVSVIVRDDVATSPTYWRGPFGLKPTLIQNQASLGQPQALAAATAQLASAKALTVTWEQVTIVPDASLELGDVVQCTADNLSTVQVLTGFTLPLMQDGAMSLILRAYTPTS